MVDMTGTLDEVVEKIIRGHVADEKTAHWDYERRCLGCGRFVHLDLDGGFERHQAKVISDYIRDRLGTR